MKSVSFILFIFLSFSLSSQDTHTHDNKCGYEEWLEEYEALNPGYTEMIQQGLRDFGSKKISEKSSSALVLIPVHVILVHSPGQAEGSGTNFSLAHVQSQIDVLNQDFGFYNTDAGGVPAQFPAGDTGIQFCLASVDPNGAATDGITRHATNTSMSNNSGRTDIISETKWPRENYMNIWSAPNLPFLGLATVPGTGGLPNSNQDFVLVAASTFGGPGFGTDAPFNLGRTATHEVGHWLGLDHIWGGGCASDDGISDTPDQASDNFGCPNHPSPSCGNSGDMFMNYMDYTNDACMFAFSTEQGQYMNTILSTSRASLLGSAGTACAFAVPLTLSVLDQQDPNCFDSNDGFILIEASGGSPNYSYSLDGGTPSNSGLFTDLAGGSYSVEVFDDGGASTSLTVFLNIPEPIIGSADITATNPCPNQSEAEITISISGGATPYFFSLNSGSNQQTPIFSGLTNGFYTYLITDNNGCTADGIVEIVGSDDLELIVDETQNVTCNGIDDGSVELSITGGTGSITYAIEGGLDQDESIFEGLVSGEYIIFATDAAGCYDSVIVTIDEPAVIDMQVVQTDVSCNGGNDGELSISANGGAGMPFNYNLNGTDEDSGDISSLPSGDYIIIATDLLGCTGTVTVTIDEPETIQIQTVTTNVLCNGDSNGELSISASGGTEMTYNFNINGVDQDSEVILSLPAGDYDIVATDELGCIGTEMVTITEPETLVATATNIQNSSCIEIENGSVMIAATGGTLNYQYTLGFETNSSGVFTGLEVGNHIVYVSDDNGCMTEVTFDIAYNSIIEAEVNIENIACFGLANGSLTIQASNTTGDPTYTLNGQTSQSENVFLNLVPGDYFVIISDETGCDFTVNATITEPSELLLDADVTSSVSCFGGDDGEVIITAVGGTQPYFYQFDSEITDPNQLSAGVYGLMVIDDNGCAVESSFTITEPEQMLDITYDVNGSDISVNAIGGTEPYLYSFNGGDYTSDNKSTPNTDIVLVSVQDANGCTTEVEIILNDITELASTWELNAYPTPMREVLNIDFNFNKSLEATIQIFDINGRLVNNISSKKYQSGENSVKIDVSNFASSIYIVKIASAEGYRYIKVIKS